MPYIKLHKIQTFERLWQFSFLLKDNPFQQYYMFLLYGLAILYCEIQQWEHY